jgi:hypothetical protein
MRWAGLALFAATLACATLGELAPASSPPPSFRAVRSLVLVRSVDDRARRPKDPLDGLDESLRARGYTTRVVELGSRSNPELAKLEELFNYLETRAGTPRGERFGAAPKGDVGRSAGEVVTGLGVDAVATYHRYDSWRFLPPSAATPAFTGTPSSGQTMPQRPPQGAFTIVDRDGHLAVFPWGESDALQPGSLHPSPVEPGAINAAEAIDQVMRTLTGDPVDPE